MLNYFRIYLGFLSWVYMRPGKSGGDIFGHISGIRPAGYVECLLAGIIPVVQMELLWRVPAKGRRRCTADLYLLISQAKGQSI